VKAIQSAPPALLARDLDLVLRATRDLFTENIDRLVVDSAEEAQRIESLVRSYAPELVSRIQVVEEGEPLFDRYGIEQEVERALIRKITLKSGVTIVIDEAEALTAIDVNTGRFVGSRDLEATILKTNLDAAKAIASQIRLRNLAGIIIVDFIDMGRAESRNQVYETFVEELAKDRAKTHVLPITGVGLVQMTRQRVRTSLGRTLTEPCPYCDGRGRLRSKRTLCHDILREVRRQAHAHPQGGIVVSAMPEVAAMLSEEHRDRLTALEKRLERSIVVEARGDLHQEVYQVSVRPRSRELP
jgi:ribonuclease G